MALSIQCYLREHDIECPACGKEITVYTEYFEKSVTDINSAIIATADVQCYHCDEDIHVRLIIEG